MTLSVIIPAYNAGKYLIEAIDSVRWQRNIASLDIEIIVSDDGSTDSSCNNLPSDIILIHNEHKCAAFARNRALEIARGDYIMFLDADDKLTEGTIFSLVQELQNNQKLDAVFGLAQDFISPELQETEKAQLSARPLPYSGILPGCALFKRSVFDAIGLFDEKFSSGETVSWMMDFRTHKFTTQSIDKVTLLRRVHMTNTGRANKSQEMRNYASAIRNVDLFVT